MDRACDVINIMERDKMKKSKLMKTMYRGILAIFLSVMLLLEPAHNMVVNGVEEMPEELAVVETNSVSDNDSGENGDMVEGNVGSTEGATESEESSSEEDAPADEDIGETVSGNEIDEELEENIEEQPEDGETTEDDMNGFSDMPSDYRLTSFQRKLKADLTSTLEQFHEEQEGENFAGNQVIAFAESEEEAELIASAYCAEVLDFDMGVVTLELQDGNTVRSALVAAAETDNNLPPVWPNYIRELFGETAFEVGDAHGAEMENVTAPGLEMTEEEYAADGGQASSGTYEQILNEITGYNDPYLKATDSKYQWFHTTVGSTYAWSAGYTGNGVRVGIIDSGVDANADLDGRIFGKRDFCDGTADVVDYVGHGTHVAGIVAAVADNGFGGAGVAPQAQIFNARVFGETESKSGYDATIIGAINYLIGEENNANGEQISSEPARVDIINMSFGGPGMSGAYQGVLDKAYQKGVIVFAATGNDGGSLTMYPASYDHVIGVSATDNNNERAYFSNYGTSTDLSAPGVNIWSTLGSSHGSLQGTSMACPMAVGEAAVILSGRDALPAMRDEQGNDKSGKARVDAVESIMTENTVSAGSGMGKGITSLAKVFRLSAAAEKPKTPDITIQQNDTKQSVKVTIRVQDGMTLRYTTNGRNPVYKNGITDDDTTLVNDHRETVFELDCSVAAKGTVKAIAINASGVSSSVKSVSYTLHPYVKTITVSGSQRLEQGKSIQLGAVVSPVYAANKKVNWRIEASQGGAVDSSKIKIDQKGKITAAADAEVGAYTVTVCAEDAGKSTARYSVQVVAAGSAIHSLAFDKNTVQELWRTKESEFPTLSLSPFLLAKEKRDGELVLIDSSDLSGRVIWSSSRPAVATVDHDGTVTAKAAGTTTITVMANDNNKRKTTVNIKVKQAVTEIAVTSDKGKTVTGGYTVAVGKSILLKAVVSPARPANKKVIWSIRPDSENTAVDSADMRNIVVNRTSGKITVKAGAVSGDYIVTAEAADGKGAKTEQTVRVCGIAIGEIRLDTMKAVLYTQKVDGQKSNTKTITATIKGMGGATGFDPGAYNVINSKPSVVKAEPITEADGTISIQLTATGSMYGKANITIVSTDGSNKKASCAVTVSGGIKKVQMKNGSDSTADIVKKITLFRSGTDTISPKSAELYAMVEGTEGVNDKAYEVKSSDPSLVQVTTDKLTGRVTVTAGGKATGKATITLLSTDGSKKKAVCTVTVGNPPSRINIAPKAGTTRYVVPGKSIQLKATLETGYGLVTDKSVTWSISDSYKNLGITISKSGKVTVPDWYSKTGVIPITVMANDGSGISADYSIAVVEPTTYISAGAPTGNNSIGYTISFRSDCRTPMSCTSSAPAVISPTITYSPSTGNGRIKFTELKKGTAIITIKALDSSGETYKITYRVE